MKLLNNLMLLGAKGVQINSDELNVQTVDSLIEKFVQLYQIIVSVGLVITLVFAAYQAVKFIMSDGQEKMQNMKTIGLTFFGLVILLLLPSIISFIASMFG